MEILGSHDLDDFGKGAVRNYVAQTDYSAEAYTSVIKMFIIPIAFLKRKYQILFNWPYFESFFYGEFLKAKTRPIKIWSGWL